MEDLGISQKRILTLIKGHRLSQKEVAQGLGISKQRVSYVIKKLIEKGHLESYNRGGLTKGGVLKELWRYHALQFEIIPYYFTKKYYAIRKEIGNHSIPFGNWKISLYSKKVIMWLEKGEDFLHEDKHQALMEAAEDFNKTLALISKKYGFRVWKDKKANIRILKHHLALTDSPLSKAVKEDFVKIKGEDGKVWLILDQSKGLREHEYVHKDRLLDDSDILEPYLNDLRNNQPLTNSQIQSRLVDVVTALEKTQKAIETLAKQ